MCDAQNWPFYSYVQFINTKAQLIRPGLPLNLVRICYSIKGRDDGPDTGIYDARGEWGNLPGGEAYVAPVAGTANGKLVVPRGWYPGLNEDMMLEFKDGYVVSLQGGGQAG